jgi:hypothetical protein
MNWEKLQMLRPSYYQREINNATSKKLTLRYHNGNPMKQSKHSNLATADNKVMP